MKDTRFIPGLFIVAALYDGLIGVVVLFAGGALFKWFDVQPPYHPGFVQFPAALLVVFAIMFVAVARNTAKNRNLIPYGIMLKASYSGVILFHWLTTGLPTVFVTFCFFDLIFLGAFSWAWAELRGDTANK